jgi:selenocysteine lyase/cysteine desulfurase
MPLSSTLSTGAIISLNHVQPRSNLRDSRPSPLPASPAQSHTTAFFDNAGGTQVPTQCIDGFGRYLSRSNANVHSPYITSNETDAVVAATHEAMADLLNAPSADEVILGANMTTLTFALSRSLSQSWRAGDEIILTKLDHDANYSPWHLAAQDRGVIVRAIDINPDDCTLNLDDFERYLGRHLDWVASLVPPSIATLRSPRAARFRAALDAMQDYERMLSERLIGGILAIPGRKCLHH